MSEHRYLRECFLERNQVPTISVMKKYMKPALANVYLKSMNQRLKVLAGIEPPLNGAGGSWYVPPKDLLEGRSVMKPLNAKYLSQLSWCGLDDMAMKVLLTYRAQMKSKTAQALEDSDKQCKIALKEACEAHRKICAEEEKKEVEEHIKNIFSQFSTLYTTSITKLEELMSQAAIKLIKDTRRKAYQKMQIKFNDLVQKQAAMIMNIYTDKLKEEKSKLKTNFILNLERRRTVFFDKLHDINLEKHIAVEKLRHFLECEKIGCQIYVAMKERQECFEQMELAKHRHIKTTKILSKEIEKKDVQIRHAEELEKETDELIKMWQEKICHVVKKFQMFVSYCLKLLPEQAEFFINMEKLMLLQLSEVIEKPSRYSMFEFDFTNTSPTPKPHPFYLVSDKDYKPKVNQNLCPEHCTSSASQMPVIVINKQCIYAACDKFEQYTDKLKDYINDDIIDDTSFEDKYNYDATKPVKCTSTQQLQDVKLESSLLQVLQQEITNIHDVSFACSVCKIPHCCDCSRDITPKQFELPKEIESLSTLTSESSVSLTRQTELKHEREPKWESYMKYVEPKKCECSKTAKKHLLEHLPAYMRRMSYYDAPDLLHYETCSATKLKRLVEIARRGGKYTAPQPVKSSLKSTKDMATQYQDPEYDNLSICFCNDDEVLIRYTRQLNIVGDSQSAAFLKEKTESFVRKRTRSLRRLMESAGVEEIFKSEDCEF